MPLFKDESLGSDDWRYLEPGASLALAGKSILSIEQWLDRTEELRATNISLGLRLEPDVKLSSISNDLSRFSLIAVNFPKFTDGRGYSLAHQLRASYGFTGELRAVGDILFDQLQLLSRCGFDSFEITDESTLKLLGSGRRPSLTRFYQPGLGPEIPEIPETTRPWARKLFSQSTPKHF
jgi:uncharacterized protein (DUF934 family)